MIPTILALAMFLDAALGEPAWLWSRLTHPAILVGNLIGWSDQHLNKGGIRRIKGAILVLFLILIAILAGWLIQRLPLAPVIEICLVAILLAQKSLATHVSDVATALTMSKSEGRRSVARIVGRDTKTMDGPGIVRSAIESAAENLSDGVVAPALFYLAFGLPGIFVYKVVNTADSMIGYKTDRHRDFGWAAARTDDVLNWIPARATAFILAILSGQIGNWRDIVADAGLHRSPNAGWPEAAMARALDVALAGPRSYDGAMQEFPYVHKSGRLDGQPSDIRAAVRWLWRVWAFLLVFVLACAALT